MCFGSTSEVLNACLSCIGCLQCPCERFSVQQPENTNTDGKLALLTRVPPHPTFGTSAGSRNADCGPGFRQDTFSQVGAGYRGERLIEPSSSPDVGKGTFSQVITLGVCVRAIPFLDASLGVVRPSAFVALDSRLPTELSLGVVRPSAFVALDSRLPTSDLTCLRPYHLEYTSSRPSGQG